MAVKQIVLLCWLWLGAVSLHGQDPLVAMGEPPERGVYDPVEWLEPSKKSELERNFQQGVEKTGVRVFVVVLPQRPVDGPASLAKRVGRKWGKTDTWGVVLHVVGDAESPWCMAEKGEDLRWTEPEEIQRAIEEVMARTFRESDQDVRVMVAARELADELGFLEVVSSRREDILGDRPDRGDESSAEAKKESGLFIRRVLMVTAPLLLVGMIVVVVVRSKSEDREPGYLFPETDPRRRFSGPWSGGGDVLVHFSEEKPHKK